MTTLPAELVDTILDIIATNGDLQTLGICALVSPDWLTRTRFHMFSKLKLTPIRAKGFAELVLAPNCTFSNMVEQVVLGHFGCGGCEQQGGVPLQDVVPLLRTLIRVSVLRFENTDWTTIPPPQQSAIVKNFAHISSVQALHLDNATFHDLRDVVRLCATFPRLNHLGAQIHFTKYTEHAIAAALSLQLPASLRTIELGTHDSIAVILSCLAKNALKTTIQSLSLQNLSFAQVHYVQNALDALGSNLRHLILGFSQRKYEVAGIAPWPAYQPEGTSPCFEDIEKSRPNPSPITTLATTTAIPNFMEQLSSRHIEVLEIQLPIRGVGDLEAIEWHRVQDVLLGGRFPNVKNAVVDIQLVSEVQAPLLGLHEVKRDVQKVLVTQMGLLNKKGMLRIQI
ncbi:hypothetical protein BDN72DRAFT_857295 [Pluteus cervinus]|uniref:Uncharacterized protein n=1 Tax=Pluteus cervinus TaxID=181527 RepID=A0ACD3AVC5_9AGAR|nr:hypothetical protein BDN72DRAFT_857295 [Pluteus cervinus]